MAYDTRKRNVPKYIWPIINIAFRGLRDSKKKCILGYRGRSFYLVLLSLFTDSRCEDIRKPRQTDCLGGIPRSSLSFNPPTPELAYISPCQAVKP